jgi:multidrug transporter EmrE-like cation transporter
MDWGKLLEVLLVVLLTSGGQLLLRVAMRGSDAARDNLGGLIQHVFQTPVLWLALGLYGLSTILWMRVLCRYSVSSVYPMVAIGYIFVTLGGLFFLGEHVSTQSWLALAVICFGTLLLAAAPVQGS